MQLLETIQSPLQSFVNHYYAVMWRLRECSANDEQLAQVVGVSSGVIRNRRNRPLAWKQGDIDRLANYFAIPTAASEHLARVLIHLSQQISELPQLERRDVERCLQVKASQFREYSQSGWSMDHLIRMQQGLNRGRN